VLGVAQSNSWDGRLTDIGRDATRARERLAKRCQYIVWKGRTDSGPETDISIRSRQVGDHVVLGGTGVTLREAAAHAPPAGAVASTLAADAGGVKRKAERAGHELVERCCRSAASGANQWQAELQQH
jgi:hypothetical protein